MIRRRSATAVLIVLVLSIAQLDAAAASGRQPTPPEDVLNAPQAPVLDQDEFEKQLLKKATLRLRISGKSAPSLSTPFQLKVASVQGGAGSPSETSQSDPKTAVRARRGIMKWILVGSAGGAVAGAFLLLKGYQPRPTITVGVPTIGVPR